MMPQTDLFASAPAASGGGAETFSPEYPASVRSGADDFLTMISQALTKNPDQPPPSPAPAPSEYSQAVDSTESDDDASDEASDISHTRNRRTAADSTDDDANSNDPSVLSTIMALFAQPPPAQPDNSKPIPGASTDKDIKIGADGNDGGTTNEKAGSVAAQKLSQGSTQKIELAGKDPKTPSPNTPKTPAEIAKSEALEAALKEAGTASADSTKPAKTAAQLAQGQDFPLAAQERLGAAVPPDGTGAALNRQRMKFVSEKNEIAGRAVQKLPDASAGDDFSESATPKLAVKSDSDFSQNAKGSFDSNLAMDFSGKNISTQFTLDQTVGKSESLDPASQVERVNQLVSQEIVTIRQSGANSLAVSLKVDQHTEIFLQLHNHDGQIQASIRFERGNIEGLGNHWGQLQESLARQNVHLQPLEDRTGSRNQSFAQSAPSTQSRAFDQSSQNRQQQTRESGEDRLPVMTGESRPVRKTQTTKRSHVGWETWA